MIYYHQSLKSNARKLRTNSTEAEKILWSRLKKKQLLNIQFYRQKPLGRYIVDFYAPAAKLVIELDGGQHYEDQHERKDKFRDLNLNHLGLKVLRFNNLQILKSLYEVMDVIYNEIKKSTRLA